MSHNQREIYTGAIIVSDAHYCASRPEFLDLLEEILNKTIRTKQLILMGDIFDALFGGVKHTQNKNQIVIDRLNEISHTIEIIYLEGNHDFNLQTLFPHISIYPLSQQPLPCVHAGKKILLAHGDYNVGLVYKLYSLIIRNPFVLSCLVFFDNISSHSILKKLDKFLAKKDDCKTIKQFDTLICKRLSQIKDCDYFIEGHFHQNKAFQVENFYYINLAAFACNQRYFTVKSSKDKEFLVEKQVSKGDMYYG